MPHDFSDRKDGGIDVWIWGELYIQSWERNFQVIWALKYLRPPVHHCFEKACLEDLAYCKGKTCLSAQSLQLCLTLQPYGLYVACRAPLSMGFSRQEYWSGLPCPPPGDLPDPGIEPLSLTSPALGGGLHLLHWEVGSLALALPGKWKRQGRKLKKVPHSCVNLHGFLPCKVGDVLGEGGGLSGIPLESWGFGDG